MFCPQLQKNVLQNFESMKQGEDVYIPVVLGQEYPPVLFSESNNVKMLLGQKHI